MEDYRRALNSIGYKATDMTKTRERYDEKPRERYEKEFIKLLREGKIEEFNKMFHYYYIPRVDLHDAELSGADLTKADFGIISDIDLSGANLANTIFGAKKLYHFNLERADLSDADLSGADLSRANLSGADLSRANLSGANLSRANLSGANLSRANLSGANLSNADLGEANLSGADLSATILHNSDLHSSILSEATLKCANLSGADLSKAILFRAILSYAKLANANLSDADLTALIVPGVSLYSAVVSNSLVIGWQGYKENLVCEDADFKNAVIDDRDLSIFLKGGNSKNVPDAVNNEEELLRAIKDSNIYKVLKKRGMRDEDDAGFIPQTLNFSCFRMKERLFPVDSNFHFDEF